MNARRFILTLGLTFLVLMPVCYAEFHQPAVIDSVLREASSKLEKSTIRRPFKFKGMNDSLQLTFDALKLLSKPETQKAEPMTLWSAGSPLTPMIPTVGLNATQKLVLQLLNKARAAYPLNTFALALKAEVLNDAGETTQSNDAWEDYLSRSQDYSSFDREILGQGQFNALRSYAKKVLRAQGLDFKEGENQKLLQAPGYQRFWHFVIHIQPEERSLNRLFTRSLLAGAILLVLCAFARKEIYHAWVFSLASLYAAVWLSYGCWIYDRAFGLPWGLDCGKTMEVFLSAAAAVSLFEAWLAWRYAHPRLEEGFRRCPHCKAIIVQLSVECSACRRKIA